MTYINRKLVLIPLITVLVTILTSCEFSQDNKGYPKNVHFPAEGGEITITGESFFWGTVIEDSNGDGPSGNLDDNDSINVTYQWLTAKNKFGDFNVKLIAEPNAGRKSRKLYFYGYFGDEYAEIKVIQNGVD